VPKCQQIKIHKKSKFASTETKKGKKERVELASKCYNIRLVDMTRSGF
jgi:hypothetical protein